MIKMDLVLLLKHGPGDNIGGFIGGTKKSRGKVGRVKLTVLSENFLFDYIVRTNFEKLPRTKSTLSLGMTHRGPGHTGRSADKRSCFGENVVNEGCGGTGEGERVFVTRGKVTPR